MVAAVLVVCACGLWLSGGVDVPTKHPPTRFYFKGTSLVLLGASLGVLAVGFLWLSFKPEQYKGKTMGYISATAFAIAALAFFLSEAY